jgi:hypothetical protein
MTNKAQTVQEIYQHIIDNLSVSDRLHLTALILNDLAQQNVDVIDASSTWTEQDKSDITSFSLQYANSIFPDEEEIV